MKNILGWVPMLFFMVFVLRNEQLKNGIWIQILGMEILIIGFIFFVCMLFLCSILDILSALQKKDPSFNRRIHYICLGVQLVKRLPE